MTTQRDRARRFLEMHRSGTLVLPNAWDAASAVVIAEAGAVAIATTSSGVSWSYGVPDGEALGRDDAIAAVARVARAVSVPVTADVEAGYGASAADVAATVEAALDAGAVGANLEDRSHGGAEPLRPVDEQCARLAAAREAASRRGIPFVLNARTDVFLVAVGDPGEREERVLERAGRYRDAGADCLFVPGVVDLEVIARLVARSPLPLNVLLAPAAGPTLRQLAEAGVRRISVGSTLARVALLAVRDATRQLLAALPAGAERGAGDAAAGGAEAAAGGDDADLLRRALTPPEMQRLMAGRRSAPPPAR